MYKYLLFPVLFMLMLGTTQAQKLSVVVKYVTANGPADNSTIYYTGRNKLTWNDFQGKPDNSVDYAALTTSGFGMNLGFHSANNVAEMTIDVFCDFSKPESWVKPEHKTDYILNHEQHHFDITYIYTQRFIKKLKDANFTTKNYQQLINKIYTDCEKEMHDVQTQYDDETQHSIIKARQEEWNKKIDAQLADLSN